MEKNNPTLGKVFKFVNNIALEVTLYYGFKGTSLLRGTSHKNGRGKDYRTLSK